MKNHEKLLALSKIMPFQCGLLIDNLKQLNPTFVWHLEYRFGWQINFCGDIYPIGNIKPTLHPFLRLNTDVEVPNELAVKLLADVGIVVAIGNKLCVTDILFKIIYKEWQNESSIKEMIKKTIGTCSNFENFLNTCIDNSNTMTYRQSQYFLNILRSLHFAVDFPEGEFEVIK